MFVEQATAAPPGANQYAGFHGATRLEGSGEHGSLMLDRHGRIVACGAPTEKLFGVGQMHLIGRSISDFVAGFIFGGNSPSYSARFLAHLCAKGEWRKFEAMDASGKRFPIELNVSRQLCSGEESFFLALRRFQGRAVE